VWTEEEAENEEQEGDNGGTISNLPQCVCACGDWFAMSNTTL
jgi:hypothetical protein